MSSNSKPFFVLAPMDDVTDTVFRQMTVSLAAPDLFFTEFVNVDGLQSPGRTRLLKKLKFTEHDRPLIAQLWGIKPENYEAVARQIADGSMAAELGVPGLNFAGIDINMGCPAKSEVNGGACSALINNRPLALDIIKATQAGAGDIPVSVKTRLGFTTIDLTWHELLLQQNLSMLTVHGRTRKEMSKVPAHWDVIGEVAKLRAAIAPQTKLVGNGDVLSRQQGIELAEQYGLDGIMIGRGVFQDPYVFAENSPWETIEREQRFELFLRHIALFRDTWQPGERAIFTLNKFCKIYINGFDGAKELRERFMGINDIDELYKTVSETL